MPRSPFTSPKAAVYRKSLMPGLLFLLLLTFDFGLFTYSQDLTYARKIIDTLCSPAMHGRGYVSDGDKVAANFIRDEFKKYSLRYFPGGYSQNFTLPVNTFPSAMLVKLNGQLLIAGKDYIVDPSCAAVKGTFKVNCSGKYAKKTFYLIQKNEKEIDPRFDGYISVQKKLTWSVSSVTDKCAIQLLDTLLPKRIKKISLEIENSYSSNYQTQNIISYIKGSEQPDSFIVYSAHYDHLGRMGKDVYFPGANDNASGIAMLLNLAKYYAEHPPRYSVAFMAFGAEEAGLVGSKYYVEHPLFPLKKIKFLVNIDLAGTGDEGITVVNGAILKNEFDALINLNDEKKYLSLVKPRGKAMNSDHYYFSEAGVKGFFIYTMGGIKAYHDIYDRPETLPLTEFEDVFRLLTDFTERITK